MTNSNVYTVSMVKNGNTVNIENRPYHHGDLRSTLVMEGLRLLAERDADSVSLREVARAAGVSATSVYRHFPDKDAMMTALALEGLKALGQAQRQAAEGVVDTREAFAATGRAYVRFALAHPALFRLIFASPALQTIRDAGGLETEAGLMLRTHAEEQAARVGGHGSIQAVRAWALVHGIAMLMLDQQIPHDEDLLDELIRS